MFCILAPLSQILVPLYTPTRVEEEVQSMQHSYSDLSIGSQQQERFFFFISIVGSAYISQAAGLTAGMTGYYAKFVQLAETNWQYLALWYTGSI